MEGQTRPKRHGILKTTFGLKWGEPVEREREEQRREEEEEEEDGDQAIQRYGCLDFGMETTLSMDLVWIIWNLRLDMVNLLFLNLGF